MPEFQALSGTTVLDLTQQLPGPYATFLLASLGARVVKVEPPSGDVARTLDAEMFDNVNAGKQSIVLDLKTEEGRDALRAAAGQSDVLVEGFRPGVAERLGAGYSAIAALRPDIVYCSLSGFGADGPYRSVPGHDLNYLGVAGGIDPDAGEPSGADHIGVPVIDLASGTTACLAIAAALFRRAQTGRGAYLDVAMLDSAVCWTGVKPPQDDAAGEPAYRVVRCADGLALSVAVLEDKFWRNLCAALRWRDWLDDPGLRTHAQRRGRAEEIRRRLDRDLATRPREEWLRILWDADVPVAPVHARGDVGGDAQVRARGLVVTDASAGTGSRIAAPLPPALRSPALAPAPDLGADTDSVLSEIGQEA